MGLADHLLFLQPFTSSPKPIRLLPEVGSFILFASGALMDATLSIVLLGSVYYSCRLILRFISNRSVILPQILFLEAEIARLSEQSDDEQISAICLRERVSGLRGQLERLQARVVRLHHHVESEEARAEQLLTASCRERNYQKRSVLVS
jgi:hypothetical protein